MPRRTRPQPARTETPEPRSLGDQPRSQVRAAQQQVAELMAANSELWDAVRTRDRRIVGLEEDKRRLGEGNAELTIRNEGLRVVIRRQQAQIDAAGRLPGDDREPTAPLPSRWDVVTNGGAYPPHAQDDLYMPGWQGRSSAQTAPLVGEQ